MKKALLPLAIAALMPVSAFAVGPIDGKVYGKINLTLVNADENTNAPGSEDQWEVNSNASRLGFKGKTELSDGLYAIYKLEYETDPSDGDVKGQTFTQRNSYVGLSGSFGTIFAGKHDTPTKLAQDKIDLFNDLEGDIKNTFEGENRESDIVMYTTPNMSGFSVSAAFIPAEGEDFDGDGEDDTGLADGISASVSYSADALYLALAMDKDIDDQDLVRLVGKYSLGDLTLGAMYQENEDNVDSDAKDESGYFLSASYKIDKIKLKVQYGSIEDDADNDEEETLSFGADYKLGKKTKLFAFYTQNMDTKGSTGYEDEDNYLGFGVEHKF